MSRSRAAVEFLARLMCISSPPTPPPLSAFLSVALLLPLRLSWWASCDPLVLGRGGAFQQWAETQITAVRHRNIKCALRRLCSPARKQRASAFLHREMGKNYISSQVWSSHPRFRKLAEEGQVHCITWAWAIIRWDGILSYCPVYCSESSVKGVGEKFQGSPFRSYS